VGVRVVSSYQKERSLSSKGCSALSTNKEMEDRYFGGTERERDILEQESSLLKLQGNKPHSMMLSTFFKMYKMCFLPERQVRWLG